MNRMPLVLPLAVLAILPGRVLAQSSDSKDPFGLFAQQQTPIDNTRVYVPPFLGKDFTAGKTGTLPSWAAGDESWGAWNNMSFVDSKGVGHSLWCNYKDCGQGKKNPGMAPLYVFEQSKQEPYGKQAYRTTFPTKLSQFQFDRGTGKVVDPRDAKQISPYYQSQMTATGSVIRVLPPTATAQDASVAVITPVKTPIIVADKKITTPVSKKKGGTTKKKEETKKKEADPEVVITPGKDKDKEKETTVVVAVRPLSDFEKTLQKAMPTHSKDTAASHAKAVKECEGLESPELRAACWRPYLKTVTDDYLKETGAADALSPLELNVMSQIGANNAAIKNEFEAARLKAKGNPAKTKDFVTRYRGLAQGAVKGYQGNIEFDVRQYAGSLKPMDQAVDARKDPDGTFDGSKEKPALNTGDGVKGETDPNKKKTADSQVNADSKKPKISGKEPPQPNLAMQKGPLTADKNAGKPEDPNKWNDTISGVKGAAWLGMLGLIFGGPVGLVLMAAIGFGMMYGISKMNNS